MNRKPCPHCGFPHLKSTISLPTNAIAADTLTEVCRVLNLDELDVVGRSMLRRRVEARQVVYALIRIRTDMSLEEIGLAFGGRDHTTVLHGVRAVAERAERDPMFRQILLAHWPMLLTSKAGAA